jgi:hypothetical protein
MGPPADEGCLVRLRDDLDKIRGKTVIRRDNGEIFKLGLGDNKAIERIAVVMREMLDAQNVVKSDR